MNLPKFIQHKDRDIRKASAFNAVQAILPLDLYVPHKRELLKVCIWKITEANGKYKTRYRSIGALNENNSGNLQHEHVVEMKSLIDRLLNEPTNYSEILNDAIACVVTKEEHSKLTKVSRESDNLNGWSRYKKAGIIAFDLVNGKEVSYD